jgi:hypothetical protein
MFAKSPSYLALLMGFLSDGTFQDLMYVTRIGMITTMP